MKHKLIETTLANNQKTFKLAGITIDETLTSNYLSNFLGLIKVKGKRETVRHLKECYNEISRFSCGIPIVVSTSMWVKRDRDNFPIKFKPFKKVLRSGSVMERRYALSILRAYESITLAPVPNLDTVTCPSKGKDFYASQLSIPFKLFLKSSRWGKDLKKTFTECATKTLDENKSNPFHFSTKRGIEGPTCLTAGKQSLAINDKLKVLLNDINSIFRKGNWIDILEENQEFFRDNDDIKPTTSKSENFLGRITFVSAPGGKSRLVAIGNYWVQDVLKGLHKTLYKVLRKQVTDGTYDQEKQSERVKTQSGIGSIWSYDLTAATDRFPIEPQSELLEFLNPRLGECWTQVLNSMNFEYKGQELFYKVGQPMGLYSSWAMFSLTHHAIVQYCAWVEKEKYPFNKYAILGDDVAIWSKSVALRYRSIINGLDVAISEAKSFTPIDDSKDEPCIAEFAKRIFVKGEEITGLPPDIQNESWKSIFAIPEFVRYLGDHNILAESTPVSRLFSLLNIRKNTKKIEELLCLLRINSCIRAPKGLTYDCEKPSWLDKITIQSVTLARCEKLAEQASELWSDLWDQDELTGQALENCLVGPFPDTVYIKLILDTRLEEIMQMEKRLIAFLPSEEFDEPLDDENEVVSDSNVKLPDLSEVEYLPEVNAESILESLKGGPVRHRTYRGKYIQLLLTKLRKG